MSTPISRHVTLEAALRTSHLVANGIEQTLRYGRIHSKEQIRKDLERTARTLLDLFIDAIGAGTISSGYRGPELNHLVGGAANSAHTVGLAFDWEPPPPPPESDRSRPIADAIAWALSQHLNDLPFDRLIVERRGNSKWLHIQAAEEGATPARLIFLSEHPRLFVQLSPTQLSEITI